MPSVPGAYNYNPVPGVNTNPEMAQAISASPAFSAIAQDVAHQREIQSMKYRFTYHVTGEVQGQQTMPFTFLVEQGADFMCYEITGSCFSYDENNATSYPIPNSSGLTDWAGRGLSFLITDTRSSRELTSGFVPAELLLTPGYGQMFMNPFTFRYFIYRNSKIRLDVRNRDNATRIHTFDIAFHGYKLFTPE